MAKGKPQFWTGDVETGRGFSGKFLVGGVYDGKRYRAFKSQDQFVRFVLGINGTIFFHYLDFDIKTVMEWCIKHKVKHNTVPIMAAKRVIEWKIGNTVFRDSSVLMQMSLQEVGESFGLKTRKLAMKNKFFTRADKKVMHYLRNDVVSLHEAMNAFYNFVGWEHFKKRTPAGIAMSKFREIDEQSYRRITEFPLYGDMDVFLQQAYFAGYYATFANEISSDEPIYKIDINSYYAAAMRDNLFPWGNTVRLRNPEKIAAYAEDELGIVKARAFIPKGLTLGFLPRKTRDGVDYPTKGIIIGAWTTPEIVYAKKLGYEFEYLEAVFWQFKNKLFSRYIKQIGTIKERATGAKRAIAKQLLVSLYGKFAERRNVSVLRKKTKPLRGFHHYIDDAMTIYEDVRYVRKPYSHREISIFTTAYARILFYDFCESVGWKNVYAIIVDSAIIKGTMNKAFRKIWIDENEIGKFKIVSKIKKVIILGRGVYALKDEDGTETIRNQGGLKEFNKLLTFADFEKVRNSKKETWKQYTGMKRQNTVYAFLEGRSKLKGETRVSRRVTIRK